MTFHRAKSQLTFCSFFGQTAAMEAEMNRKLQSDRT